jgi:Tol biopolymer transport system component
VQLFGKEHVGRRAVFHVEIVADILAVGANYGTLALSPDGQRVAVTERSSAQGRADIWVVERARGVSSRFTFDAATDDWPIWSPNGDRIAFTSNRDASNFDVYMKPSSGVADDSLYCHLNFDAGPSDWSRDGRYIALEVFGSGTRWDLWVLPTFGDRKPFPFSQTTFSEWDGRFSPDGRWMMYSSSESGRREVYVRAFPGPGGKWQVSTQGGHDAEWRRDGREILYLSPEADMMSVDVGAGADFQVGVPRKLFHAGRVEDNPSGRSWDLSADGQQFLLQKPIKAATVAGITVMLNWDAGLKRK